MKKIIVTFLAFIIVLSGCGSSGGKKQKEVVFYIARHGKTMLNTTDRVQGWADAVLTKEGEEVIGYLAKGLQDIKLSSVYSSDSGRAMQTANIILKQNQQKNVSLQTDMRFREFGFGMYEGEFNHIMWTDIAEKQGKTLEEWMAQPVAVKDFANIVAELDKTKADGKNWPAEDYEAITKRIKEGMQEIAEKVSKEGGGNVLLVSHGLTIASIVDVLSEGQKSGFGGKNASVTKITYSEGKWTIDEITSLDYVEKGKKM